MSMKTVSINLARAFKVRTELNKQIRQKMTNFRSAPAFVKADELKTKLSIFDEGDFKQEMGIFDDLVDAKENLDIAIEKANVGGQVILRKIDALNRKLEMLTVLRDTCRGAADHDRYFNSVTGKFEVEKLVEFLPPVDLYNAGIAECEAEKRELENQLSEFNAKTPIEFEVSDTIASKIGF